MTPRRWLAAGGLALALALVAGRVFAGWYVEHEWYAAVGALPMWRARLVNTLLLKGGAFAAAFLFGFLNLWGVRSSVVQLVLPRRVGNIEIGEQVPSRLLFLVTLGLAVVLAALLAWLQEDWLALAQVRYAREFNNLASHYLVDYGYWVTWLPFEQSLYAWSVAMLLVTGAAVIFLYALTPSLRWERGTLRVSTWVRRHLAVLGAVTLVLVAWSYRLDYYALAVHGSGRSPADEGAFTSVDKLWGLPATFGLALASLSSAVVVLWAGWTRQVRVAVGTVTTLLVLSLVVRWVGPMVGPRLDGATAAESVRQFQTLRTSMTSYAFQLGRVQAVDTAEAPPYVLDPAHDVSAFDAAALERTVERAHRAGQVRSAWQARDDGLWALVVSAGDGGATAPWTAARAPAWQGGPFVPRLPEAPAGSVSRDVTLPPALVHDSAQGIAIVSDSLGQVAGGSLATGWGRVLHAWAQQNPRIVTGDLPGAFPRVVLNRAVRDRVRLIVPFLEQGRAVTPLLAGDSLYWSVELYTSSVGFPFSRHVYTGAMGEVAYLRFAGVALVQAYTGRVLIVPAPTRDPVLKGWMAAFPALFTAPERVNPRLLAALPPAVDLVETQASVLAATGRGADVAPRHLPPIIAGDTLVAMGGPTLFLTGEGGSRMLTMSIPLLDALDRVQGLVVGTGGLLPATWWIPVASPEARWGSVLDALARSSEPLVASGALPRGERTVPGRVVALPTAQGPWFAQPQYLWPVNGAPAVSHVALWRAGSASAARD
ncbi:MAG: UPF0182 family protein, partial [Gemmatimonadetes bacterium]|nr:UPF0182 family protein [Gemmatimonadota bacterium]